jgi:hypothetical protein
MRLHARIHGEPLPAAAGDETPIVARDPDEPVLVEREAGGYRISVGLV